MKSKGEIVLICAIIGVVALVVFLFPPVRNFLFHHGASEAPQESAAPSSAGAPVSEAVVEAPRNQFPMAQYTVPSLYRKMKFVFDEKGAKRAVFYYWYGPQNLPAGTKLPLVVVLHDHDGMDYGAMYLRTTAVQREFPSFLLIPQSPAGKVWSSPAKYSGQEFPPTQAAPPLTPPSQQSLPDVLNLLARIVKVAPVDESRIYIVGCDEGGTGAYGALASYPDIFAGGVEAGGTWSFLDAGKLSHTPLLLLQGATDVTVSPDFTRNMDQMIKQMGGKSYMGEFPNTGHECASPAYYSHAVWKWLFGQRRAAASTPISP
jgi:predicted peptidase